MLSFHIAVHKTQPAAPAQASAGASIALDFSLTIAIMIITPSMIISASMAAVTGVTLVLNLFVTLNKTIQSAKGAKVPQILLALYIGRTVMQTREGVRARLLHLDFLDLVHSRILSLH